MVMKKSLLKAASAALALSVLVASGPAGVRAQQPAAVMFDQPVLITSVGQSPDVQLAVVLAKRAGLEHTLVKMATDKDVAGAKTIALVLGASLKGLGAAGVDTVKEKARVKALLAEAARRKIPVLGLHLGGDQRRGELTDELVAEFLPAAKMAVIVKSANKDGLFTKVCRAGNIPLVEVEKTADAAEVLRTVFRPKS